MHSHHRTDIRVVSKVESIEDLEERQRVAQFVADFADQHGCEPEFVVRSPGRINLIGDHVDYHGFSVLPMAIGNSILVGLSLKQPLGRSQLDSHKQDINEHHIRIVNGNSAIYKQFQGKHSFGYGCLLDKSHEWFNYILCGYHGVLANKLLQVEADQVHEHANLKLGPQPEELDRGLSERLGHDLSLFVDSNLPPASGLSSSSALVCASAVATRLFISSLAGCDGRGDGNEGGGNPNEQPAASGQRRPTWSGAGQIDSISLAAQCAKFEHLIGTHGGGMDQAVILTAQENYAKHVEFAPQFKCSNVRLPDNVVWLVSHCGVSYPKAATSAFNSRVLETKLAAAMILTVLASDPQWSSRCRRLRGVSLDDSITLGWLRSELFGAQMSTSAICATLRERVFKGTRAQLSIDEICSGLAMSRPELIERFKTSEQFLVRSGLSERVELLKRCLHVYQEAERVEQFKLICETTCDLCQLGQLMSASHSSLRHQYECSHPNLDRLVEVSLGAGALGARLTGAGWGGCIVSLVEADKCQQVRAALERVSKFTFSTEPRSGCTIIKLDRG